MRVLQVVIGVSLYFVGLLAIVLVWLHVMGFGTVTKNYLQFLKNLEAKDYLQLLQISATYIAASAAAIFAQNAVRRQKENASTLEWLKVQLAHVAVKEHEAYHTMWEAVSKYYRALKYLEDGQYKESLIKDAEIACEEAESHSLLVKKSYIDAFYNYWEEAGYIAESAKGIRQNSEGIKTLWSNENKHFSQKYLQIKTL